MLLYTATIYATCFVLLIIAVYDALGNYIRIICFIGCFQKVEESEGNTWDVLRDNYMMGSTMKDWDRNYDNDSVTENVLDIDSSSDT